MKLNEYELQGILLDHLPCIALILKKGSREIVYSNKSAQMAGATPGKTCFSSCAERDKPCDFCRAPVLWANNQPQQLEVKYRGKNYEGRWMTLSKDYYVHYIFDITETKKAEEELKKHRRHLEDMLEKRTKEIYQIEAHLLQSERLAATGMLVASIAHEINNPLQGILLHLDLLKSGLAHDPKKLKNFEHVKSNLNKIAGIVGQLLSTYSNPDQEKTSINMNDLIKQVATFIKNKLHIEKVRLDLALDNNLPLISGWPQQLHQVILNLFLNSLESFDGGGTISVHTKQEDESIRISIQDNGSGISPEIIPQVFDPFFSTKKKSGLGLFISQGIIKNHQGKLTVESNEGKGTLFSITLPKEKKNEKHFIG